VASALDGADVAFLMAPPGYTNQDVLLAPVIESARAHGVGRVVLMTAMGADADPSAPMRKAEVQLEQSGLRWNVIRPNWFIQNFHTFWLHGIRYANAIQLPTGSARGSFIDARDIAAVAAALLQGHGPANQAFDLTGGEALDHHEVAAILSTVAERPIGYQDVSPDELRPGLLAAGLPADYAEFLLTILHVFKLGYSARTTDAVQTITGQAPRTFEAYAKEHASWFTQGDTAGVG
jgi:uncharacterized protein YbjT (DUF2867 family)